MWLKFHRMVCELQLCQEIWSGGITSQFSELSFSNDKLQKMAEAEDDTILCTDLKT